MGIKLANNAFGTLAAGIASDATSITLTTGHGDRFPFLSAGDYFYATLIDTSNNLEIVKCTARSTDVLTVTRAQEGTTARAYSAGDRIEIRLTAQTFLDASGDHVHPTDTSRAPLASPSFTGTPTAPTPATGTRSTQLATTAFVGAECQIAAPVGSVYTFAGATVPTGWLKCNGALLSRTTYAALFAVIGTTYGAGDGSTTFALPDLRGEFVRGVDDGRGVDAGRTLGSAQAATRVIRDWWSDGGKGKDALAWNGSAVVCDYDGSIERVIDVFGPTWTGNRNSDTWIHVDGVRARPRNVAMHYIIKY